MRTRLGYLLLLVFVFALPVAAQTDDGGPPADYVSDGCSVFPDGNYRDCCVAHDKDYYKGGSCKERRASDGRLYRCVKNKKGWYNKFVAPIMWVGVRVMGTSILPTPYRWGFGKKKNKKAKKEAEAPVKKPDETPKEKVDGAVETESEKPV